MTEHVKNVTETLIKKTNLRKNDHVLDIASNDGTLLNFYPKTSITFGIDPLIDKYKKNYKNINFKISDFFSRRKILRKTKNKFKIISALSVFYDLKYPNKFMRDVEKLLERNGIALIEFADLASMIKFNMFDAICHEHITYYSSKIISEIAKKNNLPDRIVDFIKTHHGTSTLYYFYDKDLKLNRNPKINEYMYNGPKPFSKETALVMMCDSVEAATKSLDNPDTEQINSFVETIIDKQIKNKQFENCDITFKDIKTIKSIIKKKLSNIYHIRVEYPEI